MKNFDWTRFTIRIAIKAKMEDLYQAWTKTSTIEKWFLSKARFFDAQGNGIDHDKNIEAGFTYAWNWFLFDETEKGKITAANGKDFLQFTFAGDCLVEINLSAEEEGYVMVVLTQKNIPTDDESKKSIRLGCKEGWTFYLLNLKSVYEGGIDLRNKNTRFKGMVNN